MKEFPSESYELESFKTGKSGKLYNLSYNSLKIIPKNDLVDLLTNDIFGFDENIIKRYSRTLLLKKLNQKLLKLYKPENIELFGLIDPRKKELTKEEKERYKLENFPKHLGIGLPHGTYRLPKITKQQIFNEVREKVLNELKSEEYSKETKKLINKELSQFYRIMKNFSDFGTTHTVKESNLIPKEQIFSAKYSRGTTDLARNITEKQMRKDFYLNELLGGIESSYKIGILEHSIIHLKINNFLNESIEKYGGVIYIDRHDTGINDINKNPKLDKYDDGGFPIISLGTLEGKSCNSEIVEYYAERIKFHLGVKPLINSPYKGGYITQKHGRDRREEIKNNGGNPKINNVIQIEVLKSLYLDEQTQEIDKDKAEWIGIGLARAEIDLGIKFGKEYFKSLK